MAVSPILGLAGFNGSRGGRGSRNIVFLGLAWLLTDFQPVPRGRAPNPDDPWVSSGSTYGRCRLRGHFALVVLPGVGYGQAVQGHLLEAETDELISPSDIRGIEVYRGAAETPLQFGEAWSPCGVILIWTG